LTNKDHRAPADRIQLPNDTLVLDALFCAEVLGGATRRTGRRLEAEGLPYAMVAGRKYRPLNEGRAWPRASNAATSHSATGDGRNLRRRKARGPATDSVNRAHAVFQAAELRNCEALDADDRALGIFPDLKTAAGAVSAKTTS
jgi:hypothetical protein